LKEVSFNNTRVASHTAVSIFNTKHTRSVIASRYQPNSPGNGLSVLATQQLALYLLLEFHIVKDHAARANFNWLIKTNLK